jgi:WD40 repeat protein
LALGEEIAQLDLPARSNARIEISSDGRRLSAKTKDGVVSLWDTETGARIASLHDEADLIHPSFDPSGQHILTVAQSIAVLSSAKTGAELVRLQDHRDRILSVGFSPDSRRIFTVSKDRDTRIWDNASGRLFAVLKGTDTDIMDAQFSPDGTRVVTRTQNHSVQLWDAESGAQIVSISSKGYDEPSVIFSPDGDRFILRRKRKFAVGADTVQLWNTSGSEIGQLLHSDRVTGLAIDPGGVRAATTTDRKIHFWDLTNGREVFATNTVKPSSSSDQKVQLAVSPKGSVALALRHSGGCTLGLWDFDKRREIASIELKIDDMQCIAMRFSSDGRRLAVIGAASGSRRRLYIFDADTGKPRNEIDKFGISDDDAYLIGPRRILVIPSINGDKKGSAPSLWDAEEGTQIATLQNAARVTAAAFGPNDDWVVTGSDDRLVRIWDATSGALLKTLSGHTDTVSTIAINADGSVIASASEDGTARVWDFRSGTTRYVLATGAASSSRLSEDRIKSLAISGDGQIIATASNKTIRVWAHRAASGESASSQTMIPIATMTEPISSAYLSFSADGRMLWASEGGISSGEQDDLLRVQSSTQELVDLARSALVRCLTPTERRDYFLDPDPPAWCIEKEKWPYHTQDWKDWLTYKRANANPPFPTSPNWQAWRAAQ